MKSITPFVSLACCVLCWYALEAYCQPESPAGERLHAFIDAHTPTRAEVINGLRSVPFGGLVNWSAFEDATR